MFLSLLDVQLTDTQTPAQTEEKKEETKKEERVEELESSSDDEDMPGLENAEGVAGGEGKQNTIVAWVIGAYPYLVHVDHLERV